MTTRTIVLLAAGVGLVGIVSGVNVTQQRKNAAQLTAIRLAVEAVKYANNDGCRTRP